MIFMKIISLVNFLSESVQMFDERAQSVHIFMTKFICENFPNKLKNL